MIGNGMGQTHWKEGINGPSVQGGYWIDVDCRILSMDMVLEVDQFVGIFLARTFYVPLDFISIQLPVANL